MISILIGIALVSAGGTTLWRSMPTDEQVGRIGETPLLDMLVPLGIVVALVLGAALIIAGFV